MKLYEFNGFCEKYSDIWNAKSSIRSRPKKDFDRSISGVLFPKEKQILFKFREIECLDESIHEEILILSLKKYLNDIVNIEKYWITKTCEIIYNEEVGIEFSDICKSTAYKIHIDELYHINLSHELIHEVNMISQCKLTNKMTSYNDACHALEASLGVLPQDLHNVFILIAVSIFETTLVKELVGYFDSDSLHNSVKYYMNDHLSDEARHYSFFIRLLEYVWIYISEEMRDVIAPVIADFVVMYLGIRGELEFNKIICSQVLEPPMSELLTCKLDEIYTNFKITSDLPIVNNVLTVLEKTGVSSHWKVKDSLRNYNLCN